MPKRQTVRRFDAKEVQGEDAFVVVSSVKVKEIRVLRQMGTDSEDFDAFEEGLKLIAKHVIDWNWVDDEGKKLPVPSKEHSVVDELTQEEVSFLTDKMMGEDEELKN